MYIARRLGYRHYQRLRAEHLAREAQLAPPPPDDPTPPPKPTKASRERERAARLRERYDALFRLEHSAKLVPWLDTWAQLQRTVGPAERHDFLDRFIRRVQRDPQAHQAELVFLLVVFDPVRGSAIKALREARFREPTDFSAIPRQRREEARMLAEVERNELDRAATEALLEAIARYPTPRPERLFPWIKNTLGHRLLDVLRADLHGQNPRGIVGAEHAAVQNTLHDLGELEAPAMAADSPQRREVRRVAVGADLPTLAGHYAEHHEVRDACRRAVGRLAPRQQQVIEAVELGDYSPEEFAERRRVTRSTVYNLAAQARNRMHDDDIFFVELHRLRIVRDEARIAYLQARYPDGYLPDGRRRVAIAA